MITDVINGILLGWCNDINDRIQRRWDIYTDLAGSERNIVPPQINDIENAIITTLEYSGMGAWIAEFGSGSDMDKSNPYLEEYLRSGNFNTWRLFNTEYPIMGRSEGEYEGIDGRTHESSGKASGLDLERGLGRNNKDPYIPFEPQHVIKEEIEFALPELKTRIIAAVNEEYAKMLTFDLQIHL